MTRLTRPAAAALVALAAAASAMAQNPPPRPPDPRPLILQISAPVALSQRPVPPLSQAQRARLQQAENLAASGLPEKALPALKALLAEVPHHPLVLTEMARVQNTLEDFPSVERLARAERLAQKDSILLGRELAQALERLGRPREAAQVAIEAWAASATEPEWTKEVVIRAADAAPREVREVVRRAAARYPERTDFARAAARLEWKLGDLRAALRTLAAAERSEARPRLRFAFAEELMLLASSRDSTGAIETWLDLAADTRYDASYRTAAARRAWEVITARRAAREYAARLQKALADLPAAGLSPELRLELARGLRQAGRTAEARALLEPEGGRDSPEFAAERALADLRDGPPARALPGLHAAAERSPEHAFRYAEALFFAGQTDSAHAWYERVAEDPRGPFTGAALERLYLLEEAGAGPALPAFGRVAYEEWRGETRRATALSDSLFRSLPRGALWAQAALALSALRAGAGDAAGALEPLLALADSLREDRLAPVARERAGDIYLVRLKDESRAAAQYEDCLARYPKAWNAPEVRRKLELLRRERRF